MEMSRTLQRPQNEKTERMQQEAIAAHLSDSKTRISLVVCGHVDAGKSTLMGRLLWELGEVIVAREKGVRVAPLVQVPQQVIHRYEKEAKAIGMVSAEMVSSG